MGAVSLSILSVHYHISLQAYVAFSRFDKILGRFLAPMSKRI